MCCLELPASPAGPQCASFARSGPATAILGHGTHCAACIDRRCGVEPEQAHGRFVMRCRDEDQTDFRPLFLLSGIRPCPSPEHERSRRFSQPDVAGWPSSTSGAAINAGAEQQPPAPPQQPFPPGQAQPQTQPRAGTEAAAGDGQWVYTSDYGWIWMPYGSQYTYEGAASDASPYSYVYYPSYGWTWLAAPWIWGWGIYPTSDLASKRLWLVSRTVPGRVWMGRIPRRRLRGYRGGGYGGYRGGGGSRAGFGGGYRGGGPIALAVDSAAGRQLARGRWVPRRRRWRLARRWTWRRTSLKSRL